MKPYSNIYEQYVDDASFLWMLRTVVIDQPHYTKAEIRELEERIESQLNGLLTSASPGWSACANGLEIAEPGEVFVAAVVAFTNNDAANIQKTIVTGFKSDENFKGLVSALGWLPENIASPWIKKLLLSKDLNHKYLALSACSVKRINPAEYLNKIFSRDDCKRHIKLYSRALRLVGELKRQDLIPFLNEAMESENKEIKFWACWSLILLGNFDFARYLEEYIFQQGPLQSRAVNIAFRVLPIDQARALISKLSNDKEQIRVIVQATGVLGDPHAINWLILKMRESAFSRLAAESFTMITGYDLDKNNLERDIPTHIYTHPGDSDEENTKEDPDANLPWPDYQQVTDFWQGVSHNFTPGQRYFMGQLITPEVLNSQLLFGNQRQRHAAGLELALVDSALKLLNTKARA